MISGGYYIKARKIQQSVIATCSPCAREIWDWLIMQANHSDNEVCARGQCIRTYEDIQEGLKWFVGFRKKTYTKWACEAALKLLVKHTMITTRKTTKGILITVCNYDTYQNPENYEDHTKTTMKTTRRPQSRHTINKNDKNIINIINTRFEEFWKLYPKKIAKPKAFKAFEKSCKTQEDHEKIIASLREWVNSESWKKENGKWIPYPQKWLNEKYYESEVPLFSKPKGETTSIARTPSRQQQIDDENKFFEQMEQNPPKEVKSFKEFLNEQRTKKQPQL